MREVSLDELENAIDTFENFIYSHVDNVESITYGYEFNLGGDLAIHLPTDSDYERMSEMDFEDLLDYLEQYFDVELYGSW
jgi:hypothetical protein